jgi:hypothetical protein
VTIHRGGWIDHFKLTNARNTDTLFSQVKDLIKAIPRFIDVKTMSEDADRMKRLITFKKKLETRIDELDNELKDLKSTLEMVNSIVLEKGFKRPEIGTKSTIEEKEESVTPKEVVSTESGPQETTVLKSDGGRVLAELFVQDDGSLRVVLAKDKDFDINTPPFNQFLVQRVLLKMQERDSELVRSGQLSPEGILRFDIIREGDTVRELIIRNFDDDRLRELKSSIRWTLEKMFEKMKEQS